MENRDRTIRISTNGDKKKALKIYAMNIGVMSMLCVAWFFAARAINKPLVLPDFLETMEAFFTSWVDKKTMRNMGLTMYRVMTGSFYGLIVGSVLGLWMGYSEKALSLLSPFVNSIRQVPIMAWVPLSIIWFGLGEGPTVFMIFMSAVFPLIINTISGVTSIDRNYFNAARSMGAGTSAIFRDIVIPGAMPGFLTGLRLALGSGWMSVICAEFIATSSGFGYLMIEAQERLQTSKLYALMIMSAIVGYAVDQLIRLIERKVTSWRFKDGKAKG